MTSFNTKVTCAPNNEMGHETKLTQHRGFILELGIMKSWFRLRAQYHMPCAYYVRLDDLGPKMCFLIWKTDQLNAIMKVI